MTQEILTWVFGGGLIATVTFLITAPYIKKKAAAETAKAEEDTKSSIIKNHETIDSRWEKIIKEIDMLNAKRQSSFNVELASLKARLKKAEQNISTQIALEKQLRIQIEERDRRINKRNYIFSQAITCGFIENPMDCVVLRTKINCDNRKTAKINRTLKNKPHDEQNNNNNKCSHIADNSCCNTNK